MTNIQIPDSLPADDKLAAMEFVAKMRASADKCGAGFIGGFIGPEKDDILKFNMAAVR